MMRKTHLHYFAGGFWLVFLFVAIIPLWIAPRYFVKSNYYQPFDKTVWLKEHPLKMTREIERTGMLKGKTKPEVENMIGIGKAYGSDGSSYIYPDKNDWSFLYVSYENGRTKQVYTGCHCN